MARAWWRTPWQARRLIRTLEALQQDVHRLTLAAERLSPPPLPDVTPDEVGTVESFPRTLIGPLEVAEAQLRTLYGRDPTDDEVCQRLKDWGVLRDHA